MRYPMHMVMLLLAVTVCVSTGACAPGETAPVPPAKISKRMEKQMMVLPVSVFRLHFSRYPELNPRYSEAEIRQLFEEVNAIWSRWGITWQVDTIQNREVMPGDFTMPDNGFADRREFRNMAASLIPDPDGTRQWRVYLVRQFPVDGSAVYIVEKSAVLYGELNKKGKRYPVILAHELGHSLGLGHVPGPDNLMYGGRGKNPDRIQKLKPAQIRQVRRQAVDGPVYMEPGKRPHKRRRTMDN